MARKKMLRQLLLPFTLLITISLIVMTWFSFSSLESFYLKEIRNSLQAESFIFQHQVIPLVSEGHKNRSILQDLCNQVGDSSKTRITVMLPNGVVIADSEEEPAKMDNHKARQEMKEALAGTTGHSIRYSNTLQRTMMYVAVPLVHEGQLIAVLRLSVTTESISTALNTLMIKIAIAVLIVAILAALTAFFISRRISLPLEELRIGAERFAQGDFENLLPIPDSEEVAQLADAMNSMASELHKRIRIITRQRNEQEAILQSMIEGVVAVDKSENIMIMNTAAGELFDVRPDQVTGKSVYEIIRNREFQDVIIETLKSNEMQVGEISLGFQNDKLFRYSSSILKGASGNTIGALLVLNDITRLHLLENVRQDFVANVSHELRTPITSIKGFVETLADGAIDDKDDAKRFLAIIEKQVNRLNAIIEDLLALADIEQSRKNNEISLRDECVYDIIKSAVEICRIKTIEKQVDITIESDSKLKARLNAHLMEQALVNLIDNAIKYSPNGGQIFVKAIVDNDELKISVRDQGHGIDKKHFPRLFERFYVIDKARSRELGGTGLGLAIVKHIAVANRGSVKVQSELGKGSVFTIVLPVTS